MCKRRVGWQHSLVEFVRERKHDMNNLSYSQGMRVPSTEATFLFLGKTHCPKLCKSPCSQSHEYWLHPFQLRKKALVGKESVFSFERIVEIPSVPVGLKDSCCHGQEAVFSRPISDGWSQVSASPEGRPGPSCTSALSTGQLSLAQTLLPGHL